MQFDPAGRLDLFFGNTASVMRHREARQVKLLGPSWPQRSALMPEVPAARGNKVTDTANVKLG